MASYAAQEKVYEKKGDRRYKQTPVLNEVAFLSVETEQGWHRGTGFLVKIEGHCIVMTAAHCLYDEDSEDLARRVEVFFGRKSKKDEASFTREFEDIYVPHHYRPKTEKDFEQDYAFIYLGRKGDFSEYKGFRLQHLDEDEVVDCKETILTGYPAETTHSGSDLYHQYSVKLTNVNCHPQRKFLTYRDATSGGMSGGPLYFTSSVGKFAFGIHVNAENGAVWLTDDEITLIGKAVLRVAGGTTVGWQHHQNTDQLKLLHVDDDKSVRRRQRQTRSMDKPKSKPQSSGAAKVRADDKNARSSLQDMQRRLQKDLGCPVFIVRDINSSNTMFVSCPAMTLDTNRVNRMFHVSEDGLELKNRKRHGQSQGDIGGFRNYWGTCSRLPIPLPPSPSTLTTPRYWETHTRVRVERVVWPILLEMGLWQEGEVDTDWLLSHQTRNSWAVMVEACHTNGSGLCTQVYRGRKQVGERCTNTMSNTPGTTAVLHYGVVLDVGRGRLAFLDLDRGIVLSSFNVQFTESLRPMFGVCHSPSSYTVTMRLVSGAEITMTDTKKDLICQALTTT